MVRRRDRGRPCNRALRAGGRGYGGGGGMPLARPLQPAGHGPPELQFQLQFTAVQEGSRGTGQGRWSRLNLSGRPRSELLRRLGSLRDRSPYIDIVLTDLLTRPGETGETR
jgi:hypothetical protein